MDQDKEKNMFTSLKSYFLANKENHHIITPLKGSCVLLEACGFSSGIWCFWNDENIQFEIMCGHSQCLSKVVNGRGEMRERIDKAWSNRARQLKFEDVEVRCLSKIQCDHHLLWLRVFSLQTHARPQESEFPPFHFLKMKARIRSSAMRSSPICGCYLKPGALAQLRNSKITAKSRAREGQVLTQILLYQLKSASELASPQPNNNMESVPCFALRIKNAHPHSLHRKKLIAVAPIFSES
ncbi:hypothetical protein M9H77_10981 [Catharanthus roseus]|uniref:Uncharacterized protein n=1 Tax=Catharanthus roseus TaxID=4058 RepID=A0ACC0BDF6_CATRO|nr:hypothetical protein M9H77_10981 [Catharanthus roseus]